MILLFSLISIVSLALFRRQMLKSFQPDPQAPEVDALIGQVAVAIDDVSPGAIGKVELRGSAWTARNEAGVTVARGARCRVTRVDGLMLFIVPEGAR